MTDAQIKAVTEKRRTALQLGHIPLRQGTSFECSKCGSTGHIHHDGKAAGPIFNRRCGE